MAGGLWFPQIRQESMQSCGAPSSGRMNWIIKLVAEVAPGQTAEHEIASMEREDILFPAAVGLTIAEGKVILEGLQKGYLCPAPKKVK
jgi:hypothetical protein